MNGYVEDIETITEDNTDFRHVLFTGPHSQLVAMCLKPEEEIGTEVHEENDQFFRVESGEGIVVIDDEEFEIEDGSAIIVPAGEWHNVMNTSKEHPLKLYTIYSPAHHPEGTVHVTKADAMAAEAEEAEETDEDDLQ